MVAGDQQPAVPVGWSESLADRSQADFDAVAHVGGFVIGDDDGCGRAFQNLLKCVIVRTNDNHSGCDVRPSQRADELLNDGRTLPREQQLRRAHSPAAASGGDQSKRLVRDAVHVAIRRENRNHGRRLCLLKPKLAMPKTPAHVCHPAELDPQTLLQDCLERRVRRSGPGGQHRNKVETAVVLKHVPTEITAEANERRSQAENRQVALFRLRVRLAVEIRVVREPDRKPSELWRSRCPSGRISVNPTHDDFPAMLAEALDVLAVCGFDIPEAAKSLACTSSQLLKLLKDEPTAFERMSRERAIRGLPRLR